MKMKPMFYVVLALFALGTMIAPNTARGQQVTVNYNFKFFILSATPLTMSSESQMTITQ